MQAKWGKFAFAMVLVALTSTSYGSAQPCDPTWSDAFAAGVDGVVHASILYDEDGIGPSPPALFLGGNFTTAGGEPAARIVRWDGQSFTPVGLGLTGSSVFAMAVYDEDGNGPSKPALFVAGNFTKAGLYSANNIARWDGSDWSKVGNFGLSSTCYGLATYDPDGAGPAPEALYAGGLFITADSTSAQHVARWDGSNWTRLDDGLNNFVYDLIEFDSDGSGPLPPSLYAAGGFTASGDTDALYIARWDGSAWYPLQETPIDFGVNATAYSLAIYDPDYTGPGREKLYVGGAFTQAGLATFANHIVSWDGTSWATLGNGVNGGVWAMHVHDEDGTGGDAPALFVGGSFSIAGVGAADGIARWSNGSWSPVGSGTDDTVRTFATFEDDPTLPDALYAGGEFVTAGGLPSHHVARWGCPPQTEPATIVVQPTGAIVCEGEPYVLSVSATGTAPISYQWYQDGVEIPGATGTSYAIAAIDPDDEGVYTVVVSNVFGSVTSAGANVIMGVAPIITDHPDPVGSCEGGIAIFRVEAEGTGPLEYRWFKDGQIIFGSTTSTYTIFPVELADAGVYTVTVIGACGSVTSNPAPLSIGPSFITNPESQTVCSGGSVTFCATADYTPPISYEWRKNGVPIIGADESCYTIQSVSAASAGEYSIKVTDACGILVSDPAMLTVETGPVIDEQPASTSVCEGQPVTLCATLATGTPPFDYTWYKDGGIIPDAPNASCYTIDTTTMADAGQYWVQVNNVCGDVLSAEATITVEPVPVITDEPVSQSVCLGNAVVFCVTLSTSVPADSYIWYKDGEVIPGAPNDDCYLIDAVTPTHVGQYSVEVINDCGGTFSAPATLSIADPPVIGDHPVDASACEDGPATFCVTVASGSAPFTYKWYKNDVAIIGANGSCYTIDELGPSHAGAYSVDVGNKCGTVRSDAATLTVERAPIIDNDPLSRSVCEGDPTTFCVTLVTGTPPLTFEWYKDGALIAGAPNEDCYTIDNVAAADEGQYSVAVSNACGGPVFSASASLSLADAPTIAPLSDQSTSPGNSYQRPPLLDEGTPPVTWTKVAGPDDLTVNPLTGLVRWDNPQPPDSVHQIIIRATNACGSDDEEWQLTVTSAPPLPVGGLVFTDLAFPLDSGLADVTVTVEGTGGTFTPITAGGANAGEWSISQVPQGEYTVTPSKAGYEFEHVQDGVPDGQSSIVITVDDDHQADIADIRFLATQTAQAALVSSVPGADESLPRSAGNVMRFTFDGDVTAPNNGNILIQELLSGGDFGPDLSDNFDFSIEDDGSGPRILRVEEVVPTLVHRTWYTVRQIGDWAGVAPFRVDYVVQVGDANNDGRVLNTDVGFINPAIPDFFPSDGDRRDVNGDGRILNTDVGVANGNIPSFPVAKPDGH